MARPVRQSLAPAGAAVGAPIICDISLKTGVAFNIGFAVDISAGAVLTFKVQHTYDDVFANNFDPSTATWFDHPTVVGKTADSDGSYNVPIMALRVNVTAWTSGTLNFTVLQQG